MLNKKKKLGYILPYTLLFTTSFLLLLISLTSIIHTHTHTIHELNALKERESLFLLTAITVKESEALSGVLHWNKGTVRFQKQVLSNSTTINLTTQTSQGEKVMTFRYTNTTGTLLEWKGSE